jgi:DNA-binding response OmpR family regulator
MDRATTDTTQHHVLVLEDDSSISDLLYWILTEAGYEVSCAESLQAARQICRDRQPDMIIADLLLPDGLGSELIQEIEEMRSGSRPPAIVMSAVPEARTHAESAGAQLCLTKPFDLSEFLDAVSGLVLNSNDGTEQLKGA